MVVLRRMYVGWRASRGKMACVRLTYALSMIFRLGRILISGTRESKDTQRRSRAGSLKDLQTMLIFRSCTLPITKSSLGKHVGSHGCKLLKMVARMS